MTGPENHLPERLPDAADPYPHDRLLNSLGLRTVVPPEFVSRLPKVPGEALNDRTGLPVETDAMRNLLVARVGQAIRAGESILIVYGDTNNLKEVNNVSRSLGNSGIRGDAAETCALVEDFEEDDIYVVRQTDAADETVMWAFGLSEERAELLRERARALNDRRTTVSLPGKPDVVLSTSVSVIGSDDPRFRERLSETRTFLDEDSERKPYDFYNEFKEYAEDQTKLKKVVSDFDRVDVEGAANPNFTSDDVENFFVAAFGGSRLSEPLYRTTLRITRRSELLDLFNHNISRELMAADMRQPAEHFAHFSDADVRVMYFDFLLHDIYEQAGFDRP